MALPTSRNTTYSAGQQLLSADVNDLQDWIVKLATIAVGEFMVDASDVAGVTLCSWSSSQFWFANASNAILWMPINAPVGAKILSWKAFILDSGTPVVGQLKKQAQPNGTLSNVGSSATSASSSTDQTISHTLATAETIVTATTYRLRVDLPVTNHVFYGGSYTLGF